MIEKVNPSHPDKVADRIAGAIVDVAYTKSAKPKVAVEVLIGHGKCHVIAETSEKIKRCEVKKIVRRIAGKGIWLDYKRVPQDKHLAGNQAKEYRCGDNGIFKGVPLSEEERELSAVAKNLYALFPSDGKFILDGERFIVCQSNADTEALKEFLPNATDVNPLGDWTGGTNVDSGATNRKLGSDMARSVTGGGLHGKDLSKADVSVNIYAFLKAQETGHPVEISCAIGDTTIDGKSYEEVVRIASEYIEQAGGFERFAEWGLF